MFPAVYEILAKSIKILRKSCQGGGQTPPAASGVSPSTTTQRTQEPGEISRWKQHRHGGWEVSGGRWTSSGGHPLRSCHRIPTHAVSAPHRQGSPAARQSRDDYL